MGKTICIFSEFLLPSSIMFDYRRVMESWLSNTWLSWAVVLWSHIWLYEADDWVEWCLQMDPTQGFAQKVIPQSLLILHGWAQVINLFGVPSSVRLLVSFCWLLLHLCCGQISRFSWVLMTQNHAKSCPHRQVEGVAPSGYRHGLHVLWGAAGRVGFTALNIGKAGDHGLSIF